MFSLSFSSFEGGEILFSNELSSFFWSVGGAFLGGEGDLLFFPGRGVFLGGDCNAILLSGGGSFLEEGDLVFFFKDVEGSPLLGGKKGFYGQAV